MLFLPGEPNPVPGCMTQCVYGGEPLMAYTLGNLLVVLRGTMLLQTIIQPSDMGAVAFDAQARLAVATGTQVLLYQVEHPGMATPRWEPAGSVEGGATVTCVGWSAHELVAGTTSEVRIWAVHDEFGRLTLAPLWAMEHPGPVHAVALADDLLQLATANRFLPVVNVWRRLCFDPDNTWYELTCVRPGEADVARLQWRPPMDEALPTLYVYTADGWVHLYTLYDADGRHLVARWGQFEGSVVVPGNNGTDRLIGAEPLARLTVLEHVGIDPPRRIVATPGSIHALPHAFPRPHRFLRHAAPVTCGSTAFLAVHDPAHRTVRQAAVEQSGSGAEARLVGVHTGMTKSVRHLARTRDGAAVLACLRFADDNAVWVPREYGSGVTLRRMCSLATSQPILHACVAHGGRYVVVVTAALMEFYECRVGHEGVRLGSVPLEAGHLALTLVLLPGPELAAVAVFRSSAVGGVLELGSGVVSQLQVPWFVEGEVDVATPVDPVGRAHAPDEDVLAVVSGSRVLLFGGKVAGVEATLHQTQTVGIQLQAPKVVRLLLAHKLAVAGNGELWIYDARGGLEFHTAVADVSDLDWISTPSGELLLAVGTPREVWVYLQLRRDYTNTHPAYAVVRELPIVHTAHTLGDNVWLGDGLVVVALGNQMAVMDRRLGDVELRWREAVGLRELRTRDVFHLAAALNGPLPAYHPQVLVQAVLGGIPGVERVLQRVLAWVRAEDAGESAALDYFMQDCWWGGEEVVREGVEVPGKVDRWRLPGPHTREALPGMQLGEAVILALELAHLGARLQSVTVPHLLRHQQATLVLLVAALESLVPHARLLDAHAQRFYVGYRLARTHQAAVLMRDVCYALHLELQGALWEMVCANQLWRVLVQTRMVMWGSAEMVAAALEVCARVEWARNKDPWTCAVMFLACGKKAMVQGVWRACAGHPEQAKMTAFLAHDFGEERWRVAAAKNAYVLLGKHRAVDAAVFFLLGGYVADCCRVLGRLGERELALAVARVAADGNGDGCTGVQLHDARGARRLQVAWTNQEAVRVALREWELGDMWERLWRDRVAGAACMVWDGTDPAVLPLYVLLRDAVGREPDESVLVSQAARLLCRMGCDTLALATVATFGFGREGGRELPPPGVAAATLAPPPAQAFAEMDMLAFGW